MGIIREERNKDIPRNNGWKQLKFGGGGGEELFIQEPEKTFSRINAETQRDTTVKILKVKDKQYKKND